MLKTETGTQKIKKKTKNPQILNELSCWKIMSKNLILSPALIHTYIHTTHIHTNKTNQLQSSEGSIVDNKYILKLLVCFPLSPEKIARTYFYV